MQVNEEKRKKFMEYAGKRVNNVLHDIQILEPMSRSASYDFTKQDVEEMFNAMQETLNNAKIEFEKKFEEKARSEKKLFTFGASVTSATNEISSSSECASPASETIEHNITVESPEAIVEDTTIPENTEIF